MNDIPDGEVEYLSRSERDGALGTILDDLERDAFEELLRLPIWASARRKNALIGRVKAIRDLRSRIRLLKATRSTEVRQVA